MDHERFRSLVSKLYGVVAELEEMFPGRHFTPDGHMVGSIGECLVADAYDLTLETASNEGFDARTADGLQVEIKATQAQRVSFRSCPEHTIVIRIAEDGTCEEFYNGPGRIVWERFEGKRRPSNGQYSIGLATLRRLDADVPAQLKVSRRIIG